MKKNWIAGLLAVAMTATMLLPLAAFAEEKTPWLETDGAELIQEEPQTETQEELQAEAKPETEEGSEGEPQEEPEQPQEEEDAPEEPENLTGEETEPQDQEGTHPEFQETPLEEEVTQESPEEPLDLPLQEAAQEEVQKEIQTEEPEERQQPVAKIGETAYPSLEKALEAAQALEGEVVITLLEDVALDGMLTLRRSNLTLDLNGCTITASPSFTGTYDNDRHLVQIGYEGEWYQNVTLCNGTLEATAGNKHTLNLFQTTQVVLKDLTLGHTQSSGAPLVVNQSQVTVDGPLSLILGQGSWYGINVDGKTTSASLTFTENAKLELNRSDKAALALTVGSGNGTVAGEDRVGLYKAGESGGNLVYLQQQEKVAVTSEAELLAALENSYITTIEVAGEIPVNAPLEVKRSVTLQGGTLRATSQFQRKGGEGSVLSITADQVTLSGVTVDASVGNSAVKYGVHFYKAAGGRVSNCTILNDGWTAINVNGSQVTVEGGTFRLKGSYGVVELSNGGDHSLTQPSLALTGNLSVEGPQFLIWTDLVDNALEGVQQPETLPDTVTISASVLLNGTAVTVDGMGQMISKPVSTPKPTPAPETPQEEEKNESTPAPTPTPVVTPQPTATARPVTGTTSHAAPAGTPSPKPSAPAGQPVELSTAVEAEITQDKAVVTLTSEQLTQAVDQVVTQAREAGASPALKVEVTAQGEAQAVEVTLPVQALSSLAEEQGATLTVSSPVAEVAFDATALSAILDQAGEEILLVVNPVAEEDLSPAQAAKVAGLPTFDLTLQSGEVTISDFNQGQATVTLPYTLSQGQQAEGVVVWYLDDQGDTTVCHTTYDAQTEKVTFVTPHFSRYAIAYDETRVAGQSQVEDVAQATPAVTIPQEGGISLTLVAVIAAAVILIMVLVGRLLFMRKD